jgi:hypothetical protein
MQAWEPVLDDKIAAVLSYVRQGVGEPGSRRHPEEVAAVRAEFAPRKTAWTEAELLAIPEDAPIAVATPAAAAPAPGPAPAAAPAGTAPAAQPAPSAPPPAKAAGA